MAQGVTECGSTCAGGSSGRVGRPGIPAAPATPALIEALKDKASSVRRSAAEAIGDIGPDAKSALPALIGLLRDEEIEVRRLAAATLGELGPEAREAVKPVIEALKDRSWRGREHAQPGLFTGWKSAGNCWQGRGRTNLGSPFPAGIGGTDPSTRGNSRTDICPEWSLGNQRQG